MLRIKHATLPRMRRLGVRLHAAQLTLPALCTCSIHGTRPSRVVTWCAANGSKTADGLPCLHGTHVAAPRVVPSGSLFRNSLSIRPNAATTYGTLARDLAFAWQQYFERGSLHGPFHSFGAVTGARRPLRRDRTSVHARVSIHPWTPLPQLPSPLSLLRGTKSIMLHEQITSCAAPGALPSRHT